MVPLFITAAFHRQLGLGTHRELDFLGLNLFAWRRNMKKFFVISLLLLAVIFQAATDTDLTPLLGTWINPEYNPTRKTPKIVYRADGIGESYATTYAKKSTYVWTYTVEESWQDADGEHWYKIAATKIQTLETKFWYLLIRISPDGTSYEEDCIRSNLREFPAKLNPKSYFYKILYRE
jgi:hypothetical protein